MTALSVASPSASTLAQWTAPDRIETDAEEQPRHEPDALATMEADPENTSSTEARPAPPASPQEGDEPEAAAPDTEDESADSAVCWVCRDQAALSFIIPLWAPILRGILDGRDPDDDQRLDFDISLRFAFVGQLKFRIGPIGLQGNVIAGGLGTHVVYRPDAANVPIGTLDMMLVLARGQLVWHALPFRFDRDRRSMKLAIWPYAGTRFSLLRGEVMSASEEILIDGRLSWWEAMIGTQILFDLGTGWLIAAEIDVGGFGINDANSLWTTARVEYGFNRWVSMFVGYFGYFTVKQREDGVETARLFLQGPVLGFGFHFF